MRKDTANFGLDLMGHDFWGTVEFEYSPGAPAYWHKSTGSWDPPEDPQLIPLRIWLQTDEPGKLGPEWEIDGALFDHIAESTRVFDAMADALCEY